MSKTRYDVFRICTTRPEFTLRGPRTLTTKCCTCWPVCCVSESEFTLRGPRTLTNQALYMLACMLYVVFQNLYDKARIYFERAKTLTTKRCTCWPVCCMLYFRICTTRPEFTLREPRTLTTRRCTCWPVCCMLYFRILYDKARIYFERAKDFDYQALYMLACMLYVVFQNLYDKARIYFERAKDFDYQALYMLACMCMLYFRICTTRPEFTLREPKTLTTRRCTCWPVCCISESVRQGQNLL